MSVARPTPFQMSTSATESSAIDGIGQPRGSFDADRGERLVDRAAERVHQHLEQDADADGAHEHREEDRRPQESAADDLRAQEHAEQQAEHDLGARGDEGVDEGVDEAGDQLRLLEEPDEVVEADELDVEQRPSGQREVERRDGRDEEEDDVEHAGRDEEPRGIRALHAPALRRLRRGDASPAMSRCGLGPSRWSWWISRIWLRGRAGRPGPAGRSMRSTSPRCRAAGPAS